MGGTVLRFILTLNLSPFVVQTISKGMGNPFHIDRDVTNLKATSIKYGLCNTCPDAITSYKNFEKCDFDLKIIFFSFCNYPDYPFPFFR
jgi:hypothetical protein